MLEWIEFDERLPKMGDDILVGNARGVRHGRVNEHWQYREETVGWKKVTHWTLFNRPPGPKHKEEGE